MVHDRALLLGVYGYEPNQSQIQIVLHRRLIDKLRPTGLRQLRELGNIRVAGCCYVAAKLREAVHAHRGLPRLHPRRIAVAQAPAAPV